MILLEQDELFQQLLEPLELLELVVRRLLEMVIRRLLEFLGVSGVLFHEQLSEP